jgi:hypothetical protein
MEKNGGIEVNPQDIINILSTKLARSEADSAMKEAVNIALTKRVNEQAATIAGLTPTPNAPEVK